MRNRITLTLVCLACLVAFSSGDELKPLKLEDISSLTKIIKPQPSESPWREVAWLTDVSEARAKAASENKPIIVFTAADGHPLSRT